jgi:ZIP family zinc transporter
MHLSPLLFALAAGAATFLGGTLTLRLRHRLGVILALAAGAVSGVALFDLLPEALTIGHGHHSLATLLLSMGGGAIAYCLTATITDRPRVTNPALAQMGPAILACHSLLDGVSIGVAFDYSAATGLLVAMAVLAHDLADGANTISLSLTKGDERMARRWLALNTVAPFAGAVLGGLISPADGGFAILLAVMAGLFLAIGLTELAPRSLALRRHPGTGLLMLAGAAMILGIGRLAG